MINIICKIFNFYKFFNLNVKSDTRKVKTKFWYKKNQSNKIKSFVNILLNKKNLYSKSKNKQTRIKSFRQRDVIVYTLSFKVTRNNVFITVIDPVYGPIFYSSGGLNYFFLRKESVAVANILLGEFLGLELKSKYVTFLDVKFKGIPLKSHRVSFIKGLKTSNIKIRYIIDNTPISYNGCDKKKRRRKKLRRR